MPIIYVTGDLFANTHQAQALAHGCNCHGSMGRGVAVGFRERYPAMFEEYRQRCKTTPREFNLGDAMLWQEDGKPSVFNLATQEHYWRDRATYQAIETALRTMRRLADEAKIERISMPRIGAGYGGLSWKRVQAVIDEVFKDWSGTLIVYEDFREEKASSKT